MEYRIFDQDTRYFSGVERANEVLYGKNEDLSTIWANMFHTVRNQVKLKIEPNQMIGLNCYDFDFDETNMASYYALVEVIDVIEQEQGIITKKLPKGKYIGFKVSYSNLGEERRKVYEYCKKEGVNIHEGFDYEYFYNTVNYQTKDAILELCLKLEDD